MLTVPLALRAWALTWRLLAWPVAGSSSHIRAGRRVVECAVMVGWLQPAGSLRTSSPGTCCSLSASLTCSGRKGIGLVSLLPRPSWGFLSECIWAVLVTQTHLERKCFSWTFYTEAFWRWVTSSSVGVSLYFVASGSELLVCSVWHPSWHHLRIVNVEIAECPCLEDVISQMGGNLLHFLLGPFSVLTRGKSGPVTFCDEFSLLKGNSK